MLFVSVTTLGVRESWASSFTYDLKTDWSEVNNPNGVWQYRQGTTVLPHQSNIGGICCTPSDGIAGGWAPGQVANNFLPFWVQATADTPGYLTGDVIVHSSSSSNGDANGQANLTWTAPFAGTIDLAGGLWYAQWTTSRSNNFSLTLNATLLTSGTVSFTDSFDRSTPNSFTLTGLVVNAGDVVQLTVQRSAGFSFGTVAGVNLTITANDGINATTVPEPASLTLLALGMAASRAARRRATPPGDARA
jgi:hypothetical protein